MKDQSQEIYELLGQTGVRDDIAIGSISIIPSRKALVLSGIEVVIDTHDYMPIDSPEYNRLYAKLQAKHGIEEYPDQRNLTIQEKRRLIYTIDGAIHAEFVTDFEAVLATAQGSRHTPHEFTDKGLSRTLFFTNDNHPLGYVASSKDRAVIRLEPDVIGTYPSNDILAAYGQILIDSHPVKLE